MAIRIPVEDDVPSVEFEDAVHLTFEALGEVPEFRGEKGRQIELKGALAMTVLAMASGKYSLRAIARWGKRREESLIPLLGLCRAPSYSTVRRLLEGTDGNALRAALRSTAADLLAGRRRLVSAVDGKTLRGTKRDDGRQTQVVTVVEHNTGIVMDAEAIPAYHSELTVGRRMLGELLDGNSHLIVGAGDALYAERRLARKVAARSRDYVFKVKKTILAS
jgi:hypothetical protein